MESVKRYKANINGKEFTVVGTESAVHMKLVTDTVNQRLKDLQELAPQLSDEDRAILLAINAVSDQIKCCSEKTANQISKG